MFLMILFNKAGGGLACTCYPSHPIVGDTRLDTRVGVLDSDVVHVDYTFPTKDNTHQARCQ